MQIPLLMAQGYCTSMGSLLKKWYNSAWIALRTTVTIRPTRCGVLNNWFAEFYGYFYGHPSSHTVVIQEDSGTTRTVILEGVPKPSMISKRQELYPQNDLDPEAGKVSPCSFPTTVLWPSSPYVIFTTRFCVVITGNILKERSERSLKRSKPPEPKRLVLDLRNNQGGEIRNGYLLLRYIMNEPFL